MLCGGCVSTKPGDELDCADNNLQEHFYPSIPGSVAPRNMKDQKQS